MTSYTPKADQFLQALAKQDDNAPSGPAYPPATAYGSHKAVQWSAPHAPEGGDAGTRLPIEQAGPTNKAASEKTSGQRFQRMLPFGLDAERARLRTVMSFEPEDLTLYAKDQHARESAREAFNAVKRTGKEDTPYGRLAKQRYDAYVGPYENALGNNAGLAKAQTLEQKAFDEARLQQQIDRGLVGLGTVGAGAAYVSTRDDGQYKHAFVGGLLMGAGRAALGGTAAVGKLGLKGLMAGGRGAAGAYKGYLGQGALGGIIRKGAQGLQARGLGAGSKTLTSLAKPKKPVGKFEMAGEAGMWGDQLRTDYKNFGTLQ